MAKAPRPTPDGVVAEKVRKSADQQIWVFVLAGREYRLAMRNVPIGEQAEVVAQTPLTWEQVLLAFGPGQVSAAALAVAVWLARRAAGEHRLSWQVFSAEWDAEVSIETSFEMRVEDGSESGESDPEA